MLVTLNDNTGKIKTLTNDQLKQTLAGYAIPQKVLYLPDYGRGNFEWMDDETCQLFPHRKNISADVPI